MRPPEKDARNPVIWSPTRRPSGNYFQRYLAKSRKYPVILQLRKRVSHDEICWWVRRTTSRHSFHCSFRRNRSVWFAPPVSNFTVSHRAQLAAFASTGSKVRFPFCPSTCRPRCSRTPGRRRLPKYRCGARRRPCRRNAGVEDIAEAQVNLDRLTAEQTYVALQVGSPKIRRDAEGPFRLPAVEFLEELRLQHLLLSRMWCRAGRLCLLLPKSGVCPRSSIHSSRIFDR